MLPITNLQQNVSFVIVIHSKTPLLLAEIENRMQTTISMYNFNIATGVGRELYTEHNDCWINLHHLFHSFPTSTLATTNATTNTTTNSETKNEKEEDDNKMSFVFGSERNGYMHLYRFDWDVLETTQPAVLGATLMNGTMIAESIVVVRPTQNLILFMGTDTEETPLDRHLYSTTLNGKQNNRRKSGHTRIGCS